MARPLLWTSSAHALTVLVMSFQFMFFRRFSMSKERERGVLSLKHPSVSNWTENDKKGEKKENKGRGRGGRGERKTGERTLLFIWVQNLIKKSQPKRGIRYVICAAFVREIPHLIWLLKLKQLSPAGSVNKARYIPRRFASRCITPTIHLPFWG